MEQAPHHVLTRTGDGLADVEAALTRLAARGIARAEAGFQKALFVTRADQTVVLTTERASTLAAELRAAGGWKEPGDDSLG